MIDYNFRYFIRCSYSSIFIKGIRRFACPIQSNAVPRSCLLFDWINLIIARESYYWWTWKQKPKAKVLLREYYNIAPMQNIDGFTAVNDNIHYLTARYIVLFPHLSKIYYCLCQYVTCFQILPKQYIWTAARCILRYYTS